MKYVLIVGRPRHAEVFYGFGSSFFGMFLLYSMLLWANMVFQGLLDTHSLLDNPFARGTRGYTHPCKFVLRSSFEGLVKVTTSLLHHADTLPADASLLRPKPKRASPPPGSRDSSLDGSDDGPGQAYAPATPSRREEHHEGNVTSVRSVELSSGILSSGIHSNLIG